MYVPRCLLKALQTSVVHLTVHQERFQGNSLHYSLQHHSLEAALAFQILKESKVSIREVKHFLNIKQTEYEI